MDKFVKYCPKSLSFLLVQPFDAITCIIFFSFFFKFIYLFLAVLGVRFCVRALSSCGERGPLLITVRGPLTIAASLVAEHRLQMRRLSSCGSRAQLPQGMWDPPRPGLEPVPPALAGRFSTTVPPGKPYMYHFDNKHKRVIWVGENLLPCKEFYWLDFKYVRKAYSCNIWNKNFKCD